jgi:hydrogenase maturation protein HypF
LLHTAGLLDHPAARPCRDAFTADARALLLTALDRQLQAPPASSLGRLFDGLAAVLGLLQRQTHEGQAALLLEALAGQSANGSGDPATDPPPLAMPLRPAGAGRPPRLDWQPLLQRLLDLRQPQGVSAARLALWIHRSVVLSLVRVARRAAVRHGCRQVALGGGCFQNALLLAGCRRGLTDLGLEPLWSQQMPANDGGLALGQLWATLNGP